jgi:hypothetical protein
LGVQKHSSGAGGRNHSAQFAPDTKQKLSLKKTELFRSQQGPRNCGCYGSQVKTLTYLPCPEKKQTQMAGQKAIG